MKPRVFIIFLVMFCLAAGISCAQKDVGEEEPELQSAAEPNGEEAVVPADEPEREEPPVTAKPDPDTSDSADDRTVIEQITAKPPEVQEDTAVTYPRPVKIKKYKPGSKEDSWFLVGGVTGERAYFIFVDPETIETNKGLIDSWSKLRFEETQYDNDGLSYNEVQISSSVDCEARTYSYTDSKFYDSLGRLVENQIVPYNPKPIIEGTVSAKIADFVCGYQHNRPE